MFATASKSDAGDTIGVAEFARLARLTGLPAVAIGGITVQNVAALRDAGAAGVAVIRAIFADADPSAAARALIRASEI